MKVYLDNCCYNRPSSGKSNMGIVEAETFIAAIQREKFDYTKWHQQYFASDETPESFLQKAVDFANKTSACK